MSGLVLTVPPPAGGGGSSSGGGGGGGGGDLIGAPEADVTVKTADGGYIGSLYLRGGNSVGTGDDGGDVYINGGDTDEGEGGVVEIKAGNSNDRNDGGSVFVTAGDAPDSGGGTVEIKAGAGGDGEGGAIHLYAGQGNDDYGGAIEIQAGSTPDSTGGSVTIQAGTGGDGPGEVQISGGMITFSGSIEAHLRGPGAGGSGVSLMDGDVVIKTAALPDTAIYISGTQRISSSTPPTAPPQIGHVDLYATYDSGLGKTKLMARFPTGAAVQVAIEP